MRKFIFALFAIAFVASMASLTSCSGAPSNEEVEKILDKSRSELTETDYSNLIDYYEAATNETISVLKDVRAAAEKGDDAKVEQLQDKGRELNKKYPWIDKVYSKLSYADADDMGEANADRFKKINDKNHAILSDF